MVLRICLWVSYECVGATIVPVGELRVCGRYPEPMAHGPEACEPSYPCESR